MTMRNHSCPKCQGTMAEGFILEERDGGARGVSAWIAGPPEKGFFGPKQKGRARHDVQSWRCGSCGYLEQYAPG